MVGVVEGRANKIIHRGVHDHKSFRLAAFHIEHARYKNAGIAHEQAAGLEDQRAVEVAGGELDDLRIGVRLRRRFGVRAVGDAEAAAEIDVLDVVAVGAQRAHEV